MSVVDDSFDLSLKLEERAAMPLAGGMMQQGYQCGMLWGAALAAGARAYQLYGAGPQAETAAVIASREIVAAFREDFTHTDCADITELNWKPDSKSQLITQLLKFFIRGGPIGCFRMAGKYAPAAYDAIQCVFSSDQTLTPDPPVSCSALLAQKMGASAMHVIMAAGFAGGIGLSGGGCGALGAAIWLTAMNLGLEGLKEMGMAFPGGDELLQRFLTSTDYEFECEAIVGRKFESPADHAAHVHAGGCAHIIAALAST